MTLSRANLAIALIGCTLVTQTAGCLQAWSPTFAKAKDPRTPLTNAMAPPTVTEAPTVLQVNNEPSATDMAGVMEKLSQVREMDPAAEQKLVAELQRTPPSSWPLVAEQYRASLAMHQQLASKPLKAEQSIDPLADFRSTSTSSATSSARPTKPKDGSYAALAAAANRPSTEIGTLSDPHDASTDPLVAQADPLTLPARASVEPISSLTSTTPPAEFASSGPTQPITTATAGPNETAAFQFPTAESVHTATQALATTPVANGITRLPPQLPNEQSPSIATDADWQKLVQKAAEDLSKRVSNSPTTTAEVHQHVSLRLLRLLSGDTEKALEPIPHIPPAEQDYWSRQIFAIATYLDHHSQPDDKRRATATVSHLDEAVSHLRELGSLSLRNFSFCKNVYGYGAFEPFDVDTFAAGEQVSLYVEVENYHSTSSEKGYCTLLGATYELLDEKGKRVTGGEFPDVDDCCRSRRRDFHIQFGLNMPQNLSPGRYRLELVVKDRQSEKLGHATATFEIRSGRK